MGNSFFFDWEIRLLEFFQSFENSFTTTIATFFSMLGEEMFLIMIVGFLYWCWDKEKAKPISLSLLFSLSMCVQIKGLVLRRRPYMDNSAIKCIRPAHKERDIANVAVQGYSCPSAHSCLSANTFGATAYQFRKKIFCILAVIVPFAVGCSRMYFGVHYPTDVFLGWIIGYVSVLLISVLYEKVKRKGLLFILISATTLPGIFYCRDAEYFTLLGITAGFIGGYAFEQKYVKFQNTRSVIKSIVRVLGGVVLFVILNVVLKLPFPSDAEETANTVSFAIRIFRYSITTFLIIGIYPKLFDKFRWI